MLKESSSATKAKPAECSYARIPKKITITLACTGPGFPSPKIAPNEHLDEKKAMKSSAKKDIKTQISVIRL